MKKKSESEITQDIKALLKTLGIWHYKHWQGQFSRPGISDIIGIYNGKFFAIEVKRPGCKLTQAQSKFLEEVCREGGIGFVARSTDDVIEGLSLQDRLLF
jgi:hypothetical protein